MLPKVKKKEEFILDKSKVFLILDMIEKIGLGFEVSPQIYNKMEEEDLRHIILNNLNTVFEGAATGETFSKRGKTDIHLNIAKGYILIAECKFWEGVKKYYEAIDQLFRYLTWRQNYGILITFSKNKSFSRVLEAAGRCIPDHLTYRSGFTRLEGSHFESVHYFPEDENKMVEVHHLFFNLYTQ
jgi:hypothetical protein